MSIVKSSCIAVTRAAVGKVIRGESLKRGAKVGVLLGVSSYVSDSFVGSLVAPGPGLWGFLSTYSSDMVASLFTAAVSAMYMKHKGEHASKMRVALAEFLYSFGSCVVGEMVVPPVSNALANVMVPNQQ